MVRRFTRITIVKTNKPRVRDINAELQWFSMSLGLLGPRDKDKSCFRVFITLLRAASERKALTSDEIASRAHLSRGTVVHHLNNLMERGIVIADKNHYLLRVENLEILVREIKQDMLNILKDIEIMAEELDKNLGLLKRSNSNK